jgi:hypothetical protein
MTLAYDLPPEAEAIRVSIRSGKLSAQHRSTRGVNSEASSRGRQNRYGLTAWRRGWIEILAELGLTQMDIRRALGCHTATVRRIQKENGISIGRRGG